MNKLEYIPGDLIFANGKLCKVVGYGFADSDFKVSEYIHGSFDNNVYIVSKSQDMVHGIPLTEEILKANDKLIHYLQPYNIYMIGWISLHPDIDDYKNRIFVVCANGEKIMQLQHLLFGLGLNRNHSNLGKNGKVYMANNSPLMSNNSYDYIAISVRKGMKVHDILEKLMPLKGIERSYGAEVCYRVPKSEFEKEEL